MKKNLNFRTAFCLGLVFLIVQITSAQKTKQVITWPYKQYVFNGSDAKQEKSGLTIEVKPLSPKNLYAFYPNPSNNKITYN
jgi:hypothetical protein